MLSNAYFLAKIRFDTAENEPAKNLQKIAQVACTLLILRTLLSKVRGGPGGGAARSASPRGRREGPGGAPDPGQRERSVKIKLKI